MNRKFLSLTAAAFIAGSAFVPLSKASAETAAKSIQNEESAVQESISGKQNEIAKIAENEKQLQSDMDKISAKIRQTNQKISEKTQEVLNAQDDVASLNAKMKETQKRIEERNNVLARRARDIQQNGGLDSYLNVLLESGSLSDFVSRAAALTTFVQADRAILKAQEKDSQTLNAAKAEVEKKLQKVQSDLSELQELKEENKYRFADQKSLKAALKEQKQAAAAELARLKDKEASLNAEEKAALAELENKQAAAAPSDAAKPSAPQDRAQEDSASSGTGAGRGPDGSNGKTAAHTQKEKAKPGSRAKHVARVSSFSDSGRSSNNASGTVEKAISAGSALIGHTSYKMGGGRTKSDIANGIFDCSSFVHWAYAQAGVDLGGSGANTDTLAGLGQVVSASQMKRGDLVFFDTYKYNGHVGIYLGGGKFLDCNSSDGVSIDNMSSGYWKKCFNGVVRRVVK
ncbi:NlpC/P60 family protein [Heyndrickxia coagulans]|uniref:C40 family peptidase n=1 Tax=Heyndrickxia coagulans TaxID=1398 RepID=UPI002EBEE039|nr:NlpC/P60 family protein [Heyndrickxia coagulans]